MRNIIIDKKDFELFINSNIEDQLNFDEIKFIKKNINSSELIFTKNVFNNIPNKENRNDYDINDDYEIEEYIYIKDKYKINYYNREEYETCYNRHNISALYYKENLLADFYFVIQNVETNEISLLAGYFKDNHLDFIFFKKILFSNGDFIRFSYIQDYSGYENYYTKRIFISYFLSENIYDPLISIDINNLKRGDINIQSSFYSRSLYSLFKEYYQKHDNKYIMEIIKKLDKYKEIKNNIIQNFYQFLNLIDIDRKKLIINMINNYEDYFE